MDLFRWFRRQPEQRAIDIQAALLGLIDPPSRSGVSVGEREALSVSAVWCAINVISQSIGGLPLVVYRKGPNGTHVAEPDHPLSSLLDDSPNPQTTAPVFWESFISHCLLWGNGVAEIIRDGAGNPVQLWVVPPTALQIDTSGPETVYRVTTANGTANLTSADVVHVPGLSPDTRAGWQLLKLARDNIGFSLAADRYGQHYFANAGNVGTFLETPNKLSDAAYAGLLKSYSTWTAGVHNTGKPFVLEEGLQAKRQQLSNEAGQYTETRRFQIEEVSRLFNVNPGKLHDMTSQKWASYQIVSTEFWDVSCKPWARKIEAELRRKLIDPSERRTTCIEFDADELLRGDITTRYANYGVAVTAGWLTADEIRAREGLPPMPKPVQTVQPIEGGHDGTPIPGE